jgi:hypothetical protein
LICFTILHYLSLFVVSLLTICWVSNRIKHLYLSQRGGKPTRQTMATELQRAKDQEDYINWIYPSLLLQLINIFSMGNRCSEKSSLCSVYPSAEISLL